MTEHRVQTRLRSGGRARKPTALPQDSITRTWRIRMQAMVFLNTGAVNVARIQCVWVMRPGQSLVIRVIVTRTGRRGKATTVHRLDPARSAVASRRSRRAAIQQRHPSRREPGEKREAAPRRSSFGRRRSTRCTSSTRSCRRLSRRRTRRSRRSGRAGLTPPSSSARYHIIVYYIIVYYYVNNIPHGYALFRRIMVQSYET